MLSALRKRDKYWCPDGVNYIGEKSKEFRGKRQEGRQAEEKRQGCNLKPSPLFNRQPFISYSGICQYTTRKITPPKILAKNALPKIEKIKSDIEKPQI
jgi:hypothetical protein